VSRLFIDAKMHSARRKIAAFDTASLEVLEQLCDSTWLIFEAQHPFRDFDQDDDLIEREHKFKQLG
jgi:hypothetical protein